MAKSIRVLSVPKKRFTVKSSVSRLPCISLLGCLTVSTPLLAATDPGEKPYFDVGTMTKIKERSDSVSMPIRKAPEFSVTDHTHKSNTSLAGLRLSLKGFRIEGDPRISEDHLAAVLEPWNDRELNFAEFEQAAHAVAQFLRDNGHPNAQVKISKARISDGVVALAVQGLTTGGDIKGPYKAPDAVEARIQVADYRVTGLTLADAAEVKAALAPWTNKSLTLQELQKPADALADLLRSKGYPLAQAYLPPQRVDEGIVEIAVQEGVVDPASGHNGIVVAGGGDRIRPGIVEDIIAAKVKPGQPLKTEDLESALLVANDYPAVKVRADLQPGSQPGTTQIEAQVDESRIVSGAVWADNYNSTYVGSERVNALLNLNSPFGYGEQLSVQGSKSDSMDSGKVAFQIPFGSRGGRAGVSASYMNLDISKELTQYNLNGESVVLSAFGSYPLLRSPSRNAYLSANYDNKHLTNTFSGLNGNDRRINIASLSLSGDIADRWNGRSDASLTLAGGHVDRSGNLQDESIDAENADTQGIFGKGSATLGRVMTFNSWPEWSLSTRLTGQYATKNLDVAEKFQLGGPAGVRAYPVGEGLGDDGWLGTVELRRHIIDTPIGTLQGFGFVDGGGINQYNSLYNNALAADKPNSYMLGGGGVGASLKFKDKASLTATFAHKIGNNPNTTSKNTDSDGHNDSARVWIMGNIVF